MQDGMERESIKIKFNKILVANKAHGFEIDFVPEYGNW